MWQVLRNLKRLRETRKILRKEQTISEENFWNKVKAKQFLWLKFRRQHSIWRYIIDFYCAEIKIWIEIDWSIHFKSKQIEYDLLRTEYLNKVWIKIIRYTNKEINENIDNVLKNLQSRI